MDWLIKIYQFLCNHEYVRYKKDSIFWNNLTYEYERCLKCLKVNIKEVYDKEDEQ